MDVIKALKESLVPRGTAPLVKLEVGGDMGYYPLDEITEAIDCLETKITAAALGEKLNPLERIAVEILLKTANIEGY